MAGSQVSAAAPLDIGRQYAPSMVAGGNSAHARVPSSPVGVADRSGAADVAAQTTATARGKTPVLRREPSATATQAAMATPPLVSTAPGHLPAAPPTNSNISMVLFELQSGIRRAEAIIQSVSTEVSSISSRMIAAKAYSLEVQAQQEITKLQMEGIGAMRQWYA